MGECYHEKERVPYLLFCLYSGRRGDVSGIYEAGAVPGDDLRGGHCAGLAVLPAGAAPEDDYLFHLGHDVSLERLLKTRHKLLGWVLVAVGLYTLYDELVMDFLRELYWNSENNWIIRVIYNIMDQVPTVLVCLALIALGAWLVRGPQQKKQDPADDPFEPFEQLPGQLDFGGEDAEEEERHDGHEQ